jgi:hypothetical protein
MHAKAESLERVSQNANASKHCLHYFNNNEVALVVSLTSVMAWRRDIGKISDRIERIKKESKPL